MAGFPWRWPSFPRDLSMVARVDALSLCCPPNLLSSSGTPPPFGPSKALSFRCLPRSRTLRYAVFHTHTYTHTHAPGNILHCSFSRRLLLPALLPDLAGALPSFRDPAFSLCSEAPSSPTSSLARAQQACRTSLGSALPAGPAQDSLPLPSDLTLALSLAALPPSSGTWYEGEGRGPRGPSPPMTSSATFALPPASPSPSSGLGGPQ